MLARRSHTTSFCRACMIGGSIPDSFWVMCEGPSYRPHSLGDGSERRRGKGLKTLSIAPTCTNVHSFFLCLILVCFIIIFNLVILSLFQKMKCLCNRCVFVRNPDTSKEIVSFVHEVRPVFAVTLSTLLHMLRG